MFVIRLLRALPFRCRHHMCSPTSPAEVLPSRRQQPSKKNTRFGNRDVLDSRSIASSSLSGDPSPRLRRACFPCIVRIASAGSDRSSDIGSRRRRVRTVGQGCPADPVQVSICRLVVHPHSVFMYFCSTVSADAGFMLEIATIRRKPGRASLRSRQSRHVLKSWFGRVIPRFAADFPRRIRAASYDGSKIYRSFAIPNRRALRSDLTAGDIEPVTTEIDGRTGSPSETRWNGVRSLRGDGLDLDPDPFREVSDLDGASGWRFVVEEPAVGLVHLVEVVDVGEEDRRLEHVAHVESLLGEDRFDVREGPFGLGRDRFVGE